jgi:hypothetical protein
MENQDRKLRFPMVHGISKDDTNKNWFTCEAIWFVKRVIDDTAKIAQLNTTFRDRALTWYIKYKDVVPAG